MKARLVLFALMVAALSACNSDAVVSGGEQTVCDTAKARAFNEEAMDIWMAHFHNQYEGQQLQDTFDYAISLMDSAINTCPNISMYYSNKLNFYIELGDKENALKVAENCMKVLPVAEEIIIPAAMLYYINGDSSESFNLYKKGLKLIDDGLDTTTKGTEAYQLGLFSKVYVLVLMRDYEEAEEALKDVSEVEMKLMLNEAIDSSKADNDYLYRNMFPESLLND